MNQSPIRRSFLKTSAILTGSSLIAPSLLTAAGQKTYKAVIIGRTGRGDYGHGLDTIFNDLENVEVVAIADDNSEGLKAAAKRSGASRTYADFREMLQREKPDLVSIASRQPDCHRAMALAAIEVGAHLYMEKPITEFPLEADEILQAANTNNVKIGVAHTRRYMDHFLQMKKLLDEGYLGEILDVRIQGKQDARVGGEDLVVLGSHDMDILRFFFGDPQWCCASVCVDGRDIAPSDVRRGLSEPYTVAGDTIRSQYQFANNLQCHWASVKAEDWNRNIQFKDRTINKWGFDIFGTRRILSFLEGVGTFVLDSPFICPFDSNLSWKPIGELVTLSKTPEQSHPIRNLIHAIETDGKPLCSGDDARWAVEMVSAVYQSQKNHGRVTFPLQAREHPLIGWEI